MYNLPTFGNERDLEIPLLCQFLQKLDGAQKSVLDVGAAQAAYYDAIAPYVGPWHGIDLLPRPEGIPAGWHYQKGDFLYDETPMADLVYSVSTVEHVGVEYVPNPLYLELQVEFIRSIVNHAREAAFITLPYGEGILVAGRYYLCGRSQMDLYLDVLRDEYVNLKFFYNPNPRDPAGWREVSQKEADRSTGDLSGHGTDTIAVMQVARMK